MLLSKPKYMKEADWDPWCADFDRFTPYVRNRFNQKLKR